MCSGCTLVDDVSAEKIGLMYRVHRATVSRWIAFRAPKSLRGHAQNGWQRTRASNAPGFESLMGHLLSGLDLSLASFFAGTLSVIFVLVLRHRGNFPRPRGREDPHAFAPKSAPATHLMFGASRSPRGSTSSSTVELEAVCGDPDVDFDAIIGQTARFSLRRAAVRLSHLRFWDGLVTSIERVGIDVDGLSTYRLVIRPRLWMLTQSRSYRIFQQSSDPNTALTMLAGWGDRGAAGIMTRRNTRGRKYRVQYAESDYRFMPKTAGGCRGSRSTLPSRAIARSWCSRTRPRHEHLVGPPVPYENDPSGELLRDVATNVRVKRLLRPGRYTLARRGLSTTGRLSAVGLGDARHGRGIFAGTIPSELRGLPRRRRAGREQSGGRRPRRGPHRLELGRAPGE